MIWSSSKSQKMDDVWFHRFSIHKASRSSFLLHSEVSRRSSQMQGSPFFFQVCSGPFSSAAAQVEVAPTSVKQITSRMTYFLLSTTTTDLWRVSLEGVIIVAVALPESKRWIQHWAAKRFWGSSLTPKRWLARVVSVLSPPRLLRPALCVHSRDLFFFFFFFMLPTAALYSTNSTGTPARLADRRRGS